MVGPEAFTEVKFLEAHRQLRALDAVQDVADRFREVAGRDSGGLTSSYRLEDADVVIVALGSVLGTAADVVDELREEGVPVGTLGITCFRPWPTDEVREALSGASQVIVLNRALSVGSGSILGQDVRLALAGETARVHDVVVGLGGRPVTRHVLRRLVEDVRAGRVSDGALTFPDLDIDLVAARARSGDRNRAGRSARRRGTGSALVPTHHRGGGTMTELKLYQIGTFAAGNRLLDPSEGTEQSCGDRANSITSGHRACRGCGEALGARVVLDAAMRATDGRMVTVNATGCLEVFSTPYPESAWRVPWLHSLFGNAAAVASGVAATLAAQGRDDVRVVAQAGDGGTVDIGLGCLSGMFERNDDVLFVCYDNQGYMNTGVQRSGATPPAASTAEHPARRQPRRQRLRDRARACR